MKRNQIFALAGLVSLFAFLLGLNIYQDNKKNAAPAEIVEELAPVAPGKKRHMPIKELTGKPVNAQLANNRTLPECRELFTNIAKMDTKELYETAESNPGALLDNTCFNAISSLKAYPYWDSIYNNCLSNGGNFTLPDCKNNLMNYRIMAIGILFDNNDNIRDLDDSTLISKLLWNFMKGSNPTQADLDYSLMCADELISRLPNLYAAHKAKFVTLMMKEVFLKDEGHDDQIEQTLTDLNSFDVDEDVSSYGLIRKIIKSKNNDGENKDLLVVMEDFIEENPKSYAGYYYAAGVAWKMKDRDLTKSYLERALEVDPDNVIVKATHSKFQTAKLGDKIFTISMSFSFSDI